MWLDKFTIRNLELIRSNHNSGKSLLDVMDKTMSPMGARMLSRWIVLPLKSVDQIHKRQQCVEFLIDNNEIHESLSTEIKSIGDLERLSSKIPLGKINPREMLAVKTGLLRVKQIQNLIQSNEAFAAIHARMNTCQDLIDRIENSLSQEAPHKLSAGGVIKTGWNEELDEWRNVSSNSKEILLQLQNKEAEETGITGLKVGYNSVFGYYFEVTNKYKDLNLIPEGWVRKQTLKGSERYINDELKQIETKILQAEERIAELEESLFLELVSMAENYVTSLLINAQCIAEIDCFLSLSTLALERDYCKAIIDDSFIIDITGGRHPVIETQLPFEDPFVPNDVRLDLDTQQIIMITGPNMSGKSAVLRQTALIALMAHMGSYVPAESAHIGLVDKIFTRVGASDNISSGESTFMVEMNETASILNNLSKRSLIILDEIGRGTSTYDGISIAWAIAEYLHNGPSFHPKTLFATHYHELSELESIFDRIKNYNVSTKEYDEKVIFLRKLVKGACASSFGIHVAQMSGMPKEIIENAKRLLSGLEEKSVESRKSNAQSMSESSKSSNLQMKLFQMSDPQLSHLKDALSKLDITSMTPIEAMLKLKELQDQMIAIKKESSSK